MLLTWLALAGVGLVAGMLGAMLGLGGGLFLVPALTLLFGLPVRVAVGASLIGVIATSVGVASVSRPGRSADVSLALRLEIAATLGALLGSLAAGLLSPRALSLLFAGITFAAAVYTYLKTQRRIGPASENAVEALFRTDYRPAHWPAGLGLMGLAGALSGLTGTGGGFIKVPVMYSLMDVPLGVATASSNFMVGITAAASARAILHSGRYLSMGRCSDGAGCVHRCDHGSPGGRPLACGHPTQGTHRFAGTGGASNGLEGAERRLRLGA